MPGFPRKPSRGTLTPPPENQPSVRAHNLSTHTCSEAMWTPKRGVSEHWRRSGVVSCWIQVVASIVLKEALGGVVQLWPRRGIICLLAYGGTLQGRPRQEGSLELIPTGAAIFDVSMQC